MKNLKLKDLKVQSFVTSLNTETKKTVKGGWPETVDETCTARFNVCNPESVGRALKENNPGALPNCYHD